MGGERPRVSTEDGVSTEELIAQLAARAGSVSPLPPPGRRLWRWFVVSLPALAVVALIFGPRPGLLHLLQEPSFLAGEAFMLLLALASAYGALCAPIPGQPAWKLWLPLLGLAGWAGWTGAQCLLLYVRLGAGGLALRWDFQCLPAVIAGGAIPAAAMVVMIRRGIGYRGLHACLCGALGAAALADLGVRLYHPHDAAVMVLVWQIGSVTLFTALASLLGPLLLARRSVAPARPA